MNEQLSEAALLMGVGMSVVFAFLILLIGGIQSIAWFERKFPSKIEAPRGTIVQNNKNNSPTTDVKPDVIAAISAAVHTYRTTHRNTNK